MSDIYASPLISFSTAKNYSTLALLLLLWSGLGIPSEAQTKGHVVSQRASPLAEAAVSADIDSDGRPDILIASPDYEKIVWHRNIIGTSGAEDRGFGPAQVITSGADDIEKISTANIDGAGGVDLVLLLEDGIAWRKNQLGNSSTDSFGERRRITSKTASPFYQGFEFGDLTGNGREDLALIDEENGSLHWFQNKVGTSEGDSDGFGTARLVNSFRSSDLKVLISDLNSDGSRDLIAGGMFFENQVGSTDASEDGFANGDNLRFENNVSIEDLNGDGDPDLILTEEGTWHENKYSESNSVSFSRVGEFYTGYISDLSFGKSDGDDDLDVFVQSSDGELVWLENEIGESGADSDGFGASRTIDSKDGSSIIPATLNSDDRVDLISVFSQTVVWYPNQVGEADSDSDGFGSANSIQVPGPLHNIQDARLADLDGDGDRDIISASAGNNQIAWHKNEIGQSAVDSGGFSPLQTITTSADSVVSLAIGDADGDGDLDIFAAYGSSSQVVWFENQIGEASADEDGFGEAKQITADITRAHDIALGDLDSDGDPDVISGAVDTETIVWYENRVGEEGADSDGFGEGLVIATGDIKTAIANEGDSPTPNVRVVSADFNGDGAPDVAGFVSDGSELAVSWFPNEIDAASADNDGFGKGVASSNYNPHYQDLTVSDVNLDGALDLVTTKSWYENRTQNAFPKPSFDNHQFSRSSTGRPPKAITTADWDKDGDPDVARLGRSYKLGLLENQYVGSSPFGNTSEGGEETIASGFVEATALRSSDLDGDFDSDLLAASAAQDKLVWYRNELPTRSAQKSSASIYVSGQGRSSLGDTGTSLNHEGVGGSGRVVLRRFGDGPSSTEGIEEENVSSFRVVVDLAGSLTLGGGSELRFNVDRFPGITNPEKALVYHRPGPGNGKFEAVPTYYDAERNEIVAETSLSMGEFVLASDANPLPVELTKFNGRWSNEAAILSWQTVSETNTASFEVQRKLSHEETWRTVGTAKGAGTSTTTQRYRFQDSDIPYRAEELSYRLRVVDTNGETSITDDISVFRSNPDAIKLHGAFPNPVRGTATLRYELPEEARLSIRIYDVLGREIKTLVEAQKKAGRRSVQIDASNLTAGTYFVRLRSGATVQTSRITVVR